MRRLAERCRTRIDTLKAQREALTQTLAELEELERTALERLRNVEGAPTAS
jgi:hypothetical protein